MDNALVRKIDIYPTLAQEAGLITNLETGVSTLVKADVSLFHAPSTYRQVNEPSIEAATERTDYEKGFQDGAQQSELVYKETVELMETALEALKSQICDISRKIEVSHLTVLSECLRAVLPSLADMAADFEVQNLIREACSQALHGKVQLMAHPDSLEKLSKSTAHVTDNLALEAHPSLSPGNVQIKWASGGGHVNAHAASENCLAVIETALNSMMNTKTGDMCNG